MPQLTIYFDGLCCHIDRPSGKKNYKRTILPQTGDAHIPYVEFYARDFDPTKNPSWRPVDYDRDGTAYTRVEFSGQVGQVVTINGVAAGEPGPKATYDDLVPKLQQICKSFAIDPGLLDNPPKDAAAIAKISLMIDLPDGDLLGGKAEPYDTRFDPDEGARPVGPVAEYVELTNTKIDTSKGVTLTFASLLSSATQTLTLLPGTRLITIGNQIPGDIIGKPSGSAAADHFSHYYTLSDGKFTSKPLPKRSRGLGTGCSNTNWP